MTQLSNPLSVEPKQPKNEAPGEFDAVSYLFNPVESMEKLIRWVGSTIYLLLRFMCVPVEMAMRWNFGERYVGLAMWCGGSFWLIAFMTGWINILPNAMPVHFWAMVGMNPPDFIPHQSIMMVIAMLFGTRFLWECVIKRTIKTFSGDLNIDTTMHTRYDGNPLPFLHHLFPFAIDKDGNPREHLIRLVFEPLFLFSLGIASGILLQDTATGSFFILSAVGMFAKEIYTISQVRNMLLDQLDADIMSRNLSGALAGKSPKDTQGLRFAGLPTSGKKGEQSANLMRRAFSKKARSEAPQDPSESAMPKSTFSATPVPAETEIA